MRSIHVTLVVAAALLAAATVMPVGEANHEKRIVWPYGQDERWIPVIAGYEVVPRPLPCDVGSGLDVNLLYHEDFEGATHSLTFLNNIPQAHGGYRNLFHVTDFPGKGTDKDHSLPNRLYMGIPSYNAQGEPVGHFQNGWRIAGTANLPPFVVPELPAFLSWKEKFEVEALLGYDHMWTELVDHTDGQVYILCSSDVETRPDKSSSQNTAGNCSPYREGFCPTSFRGHGGWYCIGIDTCYAYNPYYDAVHFDTIPLHMVDPKAPHWHNRYVLIPEYFIGREVTLRFSIDSADGVSNNFLGWMIDDIKISSAVLPEPFTYVPTGFLPEIDP